MAPVLIGLGIFGAALLYGDGMITPAISVLSAVEGLQVATPLFAPYVVPMAVAILVVLFLFQSRNAQCWSPLRADHGGLVRRDRRPRVSAG